MLILDVDGRVHEFAGTRKKDGSSFVIRYQEARLVQEAHLDRVVKISISDMAKYEAGLYTLSADSFRPGDYERLTMNFIRLIPLSEARTIADRTLKAAKSS